MVISGKVELRISRLLFPVLHPHIFGPPIIDIRRHLPPFRRPRVRASGDLQDRTIDDGGVFVDSDRAAGGAGRPQRRSECALMYVGIPEPKQLPKLGAIR